MAKTANLRKYILIFFIANLVGSIIIGTIFAFFKLGGTTVAGFGVLFAASYVTVRKFIMDNARPPNKSEKIKLIIYSLISRWLTSLFLLSAFLFIYSMSYQKQLWILRSAFPIHTILLGIAFDLIISVLVLWLSYDFMARKPHKEQK